VARITLQVGAGARAVGGHAGAEALGAVGGAAPRGAHLARAASPAAGAAVVAVGGGEHADLRADGSAVARSGRAGDLARRAREPTGAVVALPSAGTGVSARSAVGVVGVHGDAAVAAEHLRPGAGRARVRRGVEARLREGGVLATADDGRAVARRYEERRGDRQPRQARPTCWNPDHLEPPNREPAITGR